MRRLIWLYAAVVLLALPAYPQATKTDPPPGSIQLLPGYIHKKEQGIDTAVGKIYKARGVTISYDIGGLAGRTISPEDKSSYAWYKEQTINNQTVRIAMSRDRELVVTFVEASANFRTVVRTNEDLADVLLMLLTYKAR
jgi:hypothetical protein